MTPMRIQHGLMFGVVFALGCSPSAPQPVAKSGGVPVPVLNGPVLNSPEPIVEPAPLAAKPVPPTPEPFRIPTDTGGKAVSKVLTPSAPAALPLPKRITPKSRTSDIERGELPLPKVVVALIPLPLPKSKGTLPSPPPERIPTDLGQQVAINPNTMTMTERLPARPLQTAITPRPTADLPLMARQLPDRASLEDPTADIATARIIFTQLLAPVVINSFARFGIPDPFEFAEHLRSKTGSSAELGTKPEVVPPARP